MPSYTSRRQLEEYRFHPAVTLLVPLGMVLLQVLIPKPFPRLAILDLPLIATIFFAVSRRHPIAGTLTGTAIGLLQDALTNQPIGINGIAKSVVGYIAASIGLGVDVDAMTTRILIVFALSLLQSVLLYLTTRVLLGLPDVHVLWGHELLRATINTAVALPVLLLLDRTKHRNE